MKKQQGFTLIELMIVVAIIAILAAIAIPQYQNYVARSQVTRVMGEAGQLKTAIEDCINNGKFTIGAPGTGTAANNCDPGATYSNIQASAPAGNAAPTLAAVTGSGVPTVTADLNAATVTIVATFGNNASQRLQTSGSDTLTWTRTATSGSWVCTSTVEQKYKPPGCAG